MLTRLLRKLDVTKDPDAILRLFSATAVLSMVIILSLAGLGFREALLRYVVSDAEHHAASVSSAILAEERDNIVASAAGGSSQLNVSAQDIPRLDRHLRRFLAPFNIVKIKIYSLDCRIIYSTEAKIIGLYNRENARLHHALAGMVDSKLEKKEEVHDLAGEQRFRADVVETYIPIRDNAGKLIGSFEIYQDVTGTWLQFKNAIAMLIGVLLLILLLVFGVSFLMVQRVTRSIKEMQKAIREQAITDPLTGIANKREILHSAEKEFSRAFRRWEKGAADPEVGFIMLDVDRFKEVNDGYGHLAGDLLLKEISGRISGSLRVFDAVGRFGGDEFLVVLPGCNLSQTRQVAEKIRTLTRERPFILEGHELRVTVSLGISTARKGDTEYTEAIKRADEGLYLAKSGGRDQTGG
ncbi:MAG TPA: GGDEF domain-containing protein [Geomonas sp.]|nr:GGDEF domain-containing protein [Geomonas sp.]